MTHKVVGIDQSDGITTVFFQVPEFDNFGANLAELEEQAAESLIDFLDPEDEDEDEDEDSLLADVSALKSELDRELSQVRAHHPEFADMIEKTTRDLLSLADLTPEQIDHAGSLLFDDEDPDEADLPDDAIAVCLPDGESWTAEYAKRAHEFFDTWPTLREPVRQAVYTYYCKYYDLFWEEAADHPEAMVVLPEPTDISIIDDRFILHTIHLHAEGSIGLEGDCLWDDERGIGILIENHTVSRAGQAEVAYA